MDMRPIRGRIAVTVLTLILVGALALGCAGRAAIQNKPGTQLQGSITLSGAFALYPMAVRWGEEFRKLYPKVKVEVSAGGAGKGMADALGGLVDIGMVSRGIDPTEIEKGAYPIGVAKDAVVATINAKNPALKDIMAQGVEKSVFFDIYINGTVRTWGEVVGRSEIKDRINVYTRSDAAGAPEIWAKYLGKKQEDLKGVGIYGDPGLLAAVQKDPLGIGFSNYNYALDMKTGLPVAGVQVVPFDVNGNGVVDPDEDIGTKDKVIAAIKKGAFPHPPARVEYFVTKGKPTGLTSEFIRWVLTEGQRFVEEAGYIALLGDALATELKKVD